MLFKGSARAGMSKVNREHLFEYSVYLASIQDQNKFSAKLDVLFEKTQHLESVYQQKIAALDELKKSFLHKTFSGEL